MVLVVDEVPVVAGNNLEVFFAGLARPQELVELHHRQMLVLLSLKQSPVEVVQ